MKRLAVLFTLLLITGVYSLQGGSEQHFETNQEPLFTGEIGVQMYSFRNIIPDIGLEGTLDKIAEMGITEIEGGPGQGLTPQEFRQMVETRGLSIPSTGAGYEQVVNNPEEVADRAKVLGAKFVMVSWIPHQVGYFGFEEAAKAVDDFNSAGKALNDHGLTLTYHFHGYEMLEHDNGTLLDYIVQNTNPEYVSFQMDIFWVQFGGGNPATILRKYSDRFKTLHLKDMKAGIEKDLTGLTDVEYNVVLGTGELDMPDILRAAKEIGIQHYFIEDESSRVMEQIPQSIEYLRNLTE